ncbi:O-antigen ligase family protein [Candidatus Falkowbacteria bacterium]|nr:O-antigen ligase family protein [Candidatus Falkowbacteria bacterium]
MLENKLEKYAKILLYAVPFLALIFIEGFYFPFIITRTVFFRLLMQSALSLYFLLLAINFKKYRPRLSAGLILVLIFLFIQLIAAIFGYGFYRSFWSDFERMEGVISLIYLAVYLFLLQIFFREKTDWLFYVRLILISSLLVSLYGLGQRFNILPVFEAGINRVTSTIGNAAFLAGYLLMAVGLGIYYYFNEARANYKYFALAATGLNIIVLFLTSTRGAILGLIFGALAFVLLNAVFLTGKIRKYSIVVIITLIVLSTGFFIFRDKFADSGVSFIKRMATISIADANIKNRLTVWRMALRDFKLHPWLGVGMENFEIIYNKYYAPDISENWFDRTHNVYIDQLVAGGIVGLIAYLAILFYLFYLLFKIRREDYWQFAVLTGLLIGYSIHNFFVFDTINTSFLYFFLIALIGFREREAAEEKNITTQPDHKRFNYAFIALIIINIFVFYKLVYLPYKINRSLYIGYYYILADTFRSYENFKYALNYKLGSIETVVQLNKMLEVLETQGEANAQTKEQFNELAREKLMVVSNNFPLDIKTKMYLGQFILNNYKDLKELDRAENLFKESIRLSPTRIEPFYLLYNLYAQKGEKEKARAVLYDLISRVPNYGGAKIMLMSELAKDDPAKAEELYRQAIEQYGFYDYSGSKKIIIYLLGQKRYEEAIPYYYRLFLEEIDRYDYHLDLAKIYYLTNKYDEAIEQINIVSAKSPDSLKDSEEFVNMLYQAYNKR